MHNMMVTFLVCCFIISIHCDRSLDSDRIRVKRSSDALCTKRPEGCFCQGQDNGCKSCNGGSCCMCDEYCLTANDCCSDFRTYCIKNCSKSSETDVILAVDTSISMHGHDLLTTIPDIMNKILVKMGDASNDTQLSLITFDQTVNTEFDFMKVSPENKSLLQRRLSSFTQSNYNVAANISNLLTTVHMAFNQNTNGVRHVAKKVLLIISRFTADVDDKISSVSNDMKTKGVEIFTIGLDNNDKSFRTMLSIAPNALHIGTNGELNVDSVNTFIDFFGYQLMDLKCTF